MSVPNRATLWGRVLVDELANGGLDAVCIAPGSRSTPLSVAFAEHPEVAVYSHLDERSAAYFALGRGRRTGDSTAIVCTSGTAAANFHPAVIEADEARVPLLILTADRPADLRDSGANQTIDQVGLYGDAVRWDADLPEPEATERTVRSLRTTAARALAESVGTPPGPVHLNCPFRKPLEPIEVPDDVPDAFADSLAGRGRAGPFVETARGRPRASESDLDSLFEAVTSAKRPLLVAGPADPIDLVDIDPAAITELSTRLGAPVLADPLSGLRFGPHVEDAPIVGGYDGYVEALPSPDVVLRFGASPTSKRLRNAVRDAEATQFVIDPAGGWREATFTATNLLAATPGSIVESLLDRYESDGTQKTQRRSDGDPDWVSRFERAERTHWETVGDATAADALESDPFEGAILADVFAHAPNPATVFVSNSMPIRDADRFGRPNSADLTVLANRGASGIDGITSTALGAGSTVDEPLVLVTGDLAFYHDSNGLLAIDRCDVDATIVLVNNDGGGIFHKLPIEEFDPPFTDQFKTPHGLEFAPFGELYGFEHICVAPGEFADAYRASIESTGTQVLEVEFDAESSHRRRETLRQGVVEAIRTDES